MEERSIKNISDSFPQSHPSVWFFIVCISSKNEESTWQQGAVLHVHTKQSSRDTDPDVWTQSERKRERRVVPSCYWGNYGQRQPGYLSNSFLCCVYILKQRRRCPSPWDGDQSRADAGEVRQRKPSHRWKDKPRLWWSVVGPSPPRFRQALILHSCFMLTLKICSMQ